MKKQVEQLIEMDEFNDGLDLHIFGEIYDHEFGYPLEFRCYGFYSLQDFVFQGLEGVVELELDGFNNWKIVLVDFKRSSKNPAVLEIPLLVKNNMKKLLEQNSFGISVPTMIRTYEECFGQLNYRQLKCSDLVELCLLIPEVCAVDKPDIVNGDCTIFPAGYQVKEEKVNRKKSLPSWVLGEVKNNIWRLLQSLSSGVALTAFVKGYEGYYGDLNLGPLQCQDMMELCRLMPDVCSVKRTDNGQYHISPVEKSPIAEDAIRMNAKFSLLSEPSIPSGVVMNITTVLAKNTAGVNLTDFQQKYLEAVGETIDAKKFGFTTLKSMLRYLPIHFPMFCAKYTTAKLRFVPEQESGVCKLVG
eukprot:GFUD01054321.1.p1 GENE.GFUD01054321.1~~GFUD01054321.1.p1  ORF type:complete len:358 (-),score=78.33 GFUD01054321.1:770-1843(-)